MVDDAGNRTRHEFDKDYWEEHWREAHGGPRAAEATVANPHLVRETSGLTPGSALDAGCGEGAEAIWLATHGWQVTAADISSPALERAAQHAAKSGLTDEVQWVRADLTVWEPPTQFDLVATSYAHPTMPQLAFYDRIAAWVAPGGTLLIVGHLHDEESSGHEHHPPTEASVTLAGIIAGLDPPAWEIATAAEHSRTVAVHGGRSVPLHDVVVRAVRRS